MKRFLLALILLLLFTDLLTCVFFGVLFFERLGLPYNSQGRFFDQESAVVYHEQHIPVLGFVMVLTLILFILGLFIIVRIRRSRSYH